MRRHDVAEDENRRFNVGDEVRLICTNDEAPLPPGLKEARLRGHFMHAKVGDTTTLGHPHLVGYDQADEYDPDDNSWRFWIQMPDGEWTYEWVHEGALEPVKPPVTQEEEDEALASIMRALKPRHLPLVDGKYGANAEDCPACIPNLDKMPYPFTCPGPQED